jgi:hypothetical protein
MSARIALPVLGLAALASLTLDQRAFAGAWTPAPGEYYSELRGGWFSSDGYHDENGDRWFIHGGGLIEQRSLLFYNELGWKPRWSLVLGIPLVSVTRRFGAAGGERVPPTVTGLGDAVVGLRYRIANGRTGAALELDWKAPLSYERSRFFPVTRADSIAAGDTDGDGDSLNLSVVRHLGSPVLGDGQSDVALKLHLGTAIPRGFLQASGGYRYRFESPKDQVVLSADLGVWLTRSLLLAGRYEGEIAGQGDRPADEPDRHRVGPTLVYRVDDMLDLFAATMHTASASNALHTDEVYVGVAFKQTKLSRLQGFLGSAAAP